MVVAALLLPTVNEVPDEFPARRALEIPRRFAGAQVILWATLGLLFGGLTQRAYRSQGAT